MTVVVVGSVNTDRVARVPRIPAPGETLLAHDLHRYAGGKGANQAVAAARAGGAAVAFVGAVGADSDGAERRADLLADGIDDSGLATVPEPTGTALITVADDGENAIVVAAGANMARTTLDDAQHEALTRADVVVAQLEVPTALVQEAFQARPSGCLAVLNAAPSAPLTDPAVADALLDQTDVLVVNELELQEIAGGLPIEAALEALAPRVTAVVVTLGAAGSMLAVGSDRRQVPAQKVDPVDTTGAGDTFCGVLAARLSAAAAGGPTALTVDTLTDAVRVASAAAALAVGRPGAQPSVPTAAEVAATTTPTRPGQEVHS